MAISGAVTVWSMGMSIWHVFFAKWDKDGQNDSIDVFLGRCSWLLPLADFDTDELWQVIGGAVLGHLLFFIQFEGLSQLNTALA